MIVVSNSPLVSYTKISPNRNSPRKHEIDTITIHCFVGQVTVERMGRSFESKAAQKSCNYGVDRDGLIGMYVEEKDRSWCSSNRDNDHRAITIECASDTKHPFAINDKVYKSLVELCADICRRNNIKELKWKADKSLIGKVDQQNMTVHRWFANKLCPGEYIYSRLGQIASEVNALLGVEVNADDKPVEEDKPEETTKPVESTVLAYDLPSFISDVQRTCGAVIDGIAGPETLRKTVTVSAKNNRRHAVVKYIQKRLRALGYIEVGTVDGVAGPKFTAAVKRFQTVNGCVVDGEITRRAKTWRKLLGME